MRNNVILFLTLTVGTKILLVNVFGWERDVLALYNYIPMDFKYPIFSLLQTSVRLSMPFHILPLELLVFRQKSCDAKQAQSSTWYDTIEQSLCMCNWNLYSSWIAALPIYENEPVKCQAALLLGAMQSSNCGFQKVYMHITRDDWLDNAANDHLATTGPVPSTGWLAATV